MLNMYLTMMTITLMIVMTTVMFLVATKMTKILIEWNLMKMMSTNMSIMIMVDVKSTAFSSCVMTITTAVILYSKYYMSHSYKKNTFLKLIMAFIISMIILIFSPNLISAILGWEGLGMTSFVLIMFYQNKKSLNSSFFTMMMNRLGDIMMILGMTKMMNLNSWYFDSSTFYNNTTMMLMILTAAFSKSAQIPFSSWLTEAMAAPTPISALVHSSTLVTAGVFILIRFEMVIKYTKMNIIIMIISMLTLIMASMNSVLEWDIKKIVALSTLSQLSMMFITISMNMYNLAMFHMLVHASFKALIFLCSSSLISFANTQDIRMMNKLSTNMFITKLSINLASLTLCGFPFMSSFYSKEMIMEMILIKKMNWILVLMFYACMLTTLFYSMKLLMFISIKKNKNKMSPQKEVKDQKLSKLILLMPSVIYGNKMNWIINMNFKIPQLHMEMKIMPAIMMISMAILTPKMFKINNKNMKNKKMLMMINYMWFMKNLSIQAKKMFMLNMIKMMKNSEKSTFTEMINMMCMTVKNSSKINFTLYHKNTKMISMMLLTATIMMI